jgi:hypothetical protein
LPTAVVKLLLRLSRAGLHKASQVGENNAYVRFKGRAQFYSVSKKRQGVSTKAEKESQDVVDIIQYICAMYTNP